MIDHARLSTRPSAEPAAEHHHVFVELDGGLSLMEAIAELRPWFAENGVNPLDLAQIEGSPGRIELQLTFASRREASLFEAAFCQAAQQAEIA